MRDRDRVTKSHLVTFDVAPPSQESRGLAPGNRAAFSLFAVLDGLQFVSASLRNWSRTLSMTRA